MIGIDVDQFLIQKAKGNLHIRKLELLKENISIEALRGVKFERGNFLYHEFPDNSYDTITCLSVIKWIHLCNGDDGIHRLFSLFSRILRPNGLLMLEVQMMRSYKLAEKKEILMKFLYLYAIF